MIAAATAALRATPPPPNVVRMASCNAMGDQHRSQPRRDVAQRKKDAERIMRHQPDVPRVMDETGRRADGEIPVGRDTQKTPGINKDGIHVAEDEQREIGARGDLICPVKALRDPAPAPGQIEASADLEEHGRHQKWFTDA